MLRTVIAAAALIAAPPAALAQAGDPFTVDGVAVDETGANATSAQQSALQTGQTLAAQRLIERLTLPEDRMEAGLPPISPGEAAEMVSGIEIADEQRSATRYIATLSVGFAPGQVRPFLDRAGIDFVEAQARPVLVAPVFDGDRGPTLSGAWREAWLTGGFEHYLAPMIAYGSRTTGEGEDEAPLGSGVISPSAAIAGDEEALRALGAVYGVDRVAVIGARVRSGEIVASGRLYDFASPRGRVARLDDDETAGPDAAPEPSQPGAVVTAIGEVRAATFARAAARIAEARQAAWKREVIVRGGEERALALTLLFDGHARWRRMQDALASASLVRDARLDGLSRDGAAMTIRHRGSPEQLGVELAARGLVLEEDARLGWTLRQP